MPVLHFSLQRLQDRLGKATPPEVLRERIPMLGCALDRSEGDEWSVELFPNRPDLLSVELLARALRAFLDHEPGLAHYDLAPARETLVIDPSARKVRPFMVAGVAHGLRLDDERLVGLMELQEDLHWGLGARRRKVSVGIHDAREIRGPFTFKAVHPDKARFVPLHETRELTLREIVTTLEKGVEYAHLVTPHEKWPLFVDAQSRVLSFPPVINGTLTTLTERSTDVLVDVTGTDERACERVLNIVMSHLAELGASLETVTVKRGQRTRSTPDLAPMRRKLRYKAARELLGLKFTIDNAADALRRLGHDVTVDRQTLIVDVGPWRADILHEVDLVEDVGIGLGFSGFSGSEPHTVTFGRSSPREAFDRLVRRALAGLGYLECMTLTLSSVDEQQTKLGATDPVVAMENPESVEQAVGRTRLVPGLLTLAARNVHRDLPQRLFEVGDVLIPRADGGRPENRRRVAGILIATDAGFTGIKSHVEALLRALGQRFSEEGAALPGFVPGRCAALREPESGRALGTYGELAPAVLVAFGLGTPTAGFELELASPMARETWAPDEEPQHALRLEGA